LATKLPRAKIGDSVLVEWEDSYGCSAKWAVLDGCDTPQTMRCRSVGWITNKCRKYIVVVPHVAENEILDVKQGCGDMAIPIRAIVRMKRVEF